MRPGFESFAFDVYGFRFSIGGASAEAVEGIRQDFAFFSMAGEAAGITLELCDQDPAFEGLPPIDASVYTPRNVAYRSAGRRFIDYQGRALGIQDERTGNLALYGRNAGLLYEAAYLYLLSKIGQHLDQKGLHRIHALGVVIEDKAVLVLLPMGGGKSTLGLHLLKHPEVRILSDDSPFLDRKGQVLAYPLRLGLLPGSEQSIPPEHRRAVDRMEFGPKHLVNFSFFKERVCPVAPPGLVLLGTRRLGRDCSIEEVGRLAGLRACVANCIVGVGLFQGLEFILQTSGWELLRYCGVGLGLDLYVHASRSEGLSNAILEAMSHGLPVVATAVGGTAEAIEDGVSGVVTPLEPRALTEAILRMCEDPERRRRLGQAARQRMQEKFSVSRMVGGYESLYERAVNNSPPPCRHPLSGLAYTGSAESPRLDDTTVFVATVGDTLNFEDCMKHLEAQTVRCAVKLIDRVAPISAAFQEMHARCATPYYVQVDEDMMLYPDTLSRLHQLITESEPGVPMVCAPLWDCDVERPILGIKIYRHDIVKRFPYPNTLRFEVDQLRKMADAGHYALVLPTEEADAVCLGEHGKHYGPETIFRRWQHLFHRRNEAGHLMWLDPWPGRLLERYVKTRDQVHLFAALGAIAGIAGRADGGGDVDWRDINPALQRLQYYFPSADRSRDAGTEGSGKA